MINKNAVIIGIIWIGTTWLLGSATAGWQVGIARVDITPDQPLWMAGYAARKHPSEGVCQTLRAKAMVIQDGQGCRAAIVTTDLIGDNFMRSEFDHIGKRVQRLTGIEREHIVFNASHTHCGPVTWSDDGALITYGLNAQQQADVNRYQTVLNDKLVRLIQQAAGRMRPAQLTFSESSATFGENRRKRINPNGPVDHRVPVLRVTDADGRLLAVLFSYACHNTTLGSDFYQYCGDYAGFAQLEIEKAHPAATAMFMIGCGGDTNPSPRGSLKLAKQHGKALAGAVETALTADSRSVGGPLKVSMTRVDLPFVDPPSQTELEQRRGKGNVYDQRLTDVLLARLRKNGSLRTSYPCPVQVIGFDDDLTLVALGGEVVVDYALRLRRELHGKHPWIVGYCNEVFAYVPSERVLAEGGYEGGDAMKYFGHYGPFKPGVEQRVVSAVKRLVKSK